MPRKPPAPGPTASPELLEVLDDAAKQIIEGKLEQLHDESTDENSRRAIEREILEYQRQVSSNRTPRFLTPEELAERRLEVFQRIRAWLLEVAAERESR